MQKYKFIWALKKWTVYKGQIGFNLLFNSHDWRDRYPLYIALRMWGFCYLVIIGIEKKENFDGD